MTQVKTKIPAEMEPAAVGGMVTDSKYVIDREQNKTQTQINTETDERITTEKTRAEAAEEALDGRVDTLEDAVGTGGSVDSRISTAVTTEKTRAEGVEGGLNTRLQTVEQLAEISVGGGDIGIGTAADFESDDPEDLAKVPTVSAILGGANDGVYDISARHNGTKYADLAAALGTNGANVPVGVRKGGMSVKFVQSSGNKYVQYRLLSNSWNIDTTLWSIDNEDAIIENEEYYTVNADESGKMFSAYKKDGSLVLFKDIEVKGKIKGDIDDERIPQLVEDVSDLKSDVNTLTESVESIEEQKEDKVVKIIKYVNSDGSGDYTDIGIALANITDASKFKRYELRVCSDYVYTLPTQLYLAHTANHPTSNTAPEYCAAITTKDYVDIVGWNRRRKIEVLMPDTVTTPQNIQVLSLQGTCKVSNIDMTIKNGRYAVHQESAGSSQAQDYHATSVLEDCVLTHLGNYGSAASWPSTYAQANGSCHGLHCIYKNVTWNPGYFMHGNGAFDEGVKVDFINCTKVLVPNTTLIDPETFAGLLSYTYISNGGAGHPVKINIVGCSMTGVYGSIGARESNTLQHPARDVRTQIPIITGHGNAPMVIYPIVVPTLSFQTNSNNVNISVIGGNAKQDIYGEDFKNYEGTIDANGICIGTENINDYPNSYSLASRLGDCSSTNKTLVVKVGNTEETITFATDFQSYTNEQVISYINSQLTNCTAVLNNEQSKFSVHFDDCVEYGHNRSSSTIYYGMPLKRTFGHEWDICPSGETPDGIALERINPQGLGQVGLFDKSLFRDLYGLTTLDVNTHISVGNNGIWVVDNTDNYVMRAIFKYTFIKK